MGVIDHVTIDLLRDVLLPLGAAALMGGALGVNREIRHKPAGLRTHALVALGAALFTLAAILVATDGGVTDRDVVSRVMQGVVAGIGFLGAGSILKGDSTGHVHGLTTASTIWVAAGLGVACGAGLWAPTLVGVALALTVLTVGRPLEEWLHRLLPDPPP